MSRGFKRLICTLFIALACCGAISSVRSSSAQTKARAKAQLTAQVDFQRQIEPILARSCYQCHGAKKAAGQLRLDLKDAAMKGGISGGAIIPGDGKQSLLLKRILGEGGEARMPMGGDPLKPAEVALIRRWIDQGATWGDGATARRRDGATGSEPAKHWAYVKPVRPALPQVKNQSWIRNPIDAFILARLEKEGLTPSPEADKATLLRRVYLDVIGLPPSVKEIDEFLADNSPDAYERVVDRLLESEHYGERWARPWLDLARYADSNGYEKDNLRVAWKFRDWVINAFNKDMPFDQFTIEQIAGDMLPNPTVEQKIATGFHRNTMVNQEGGIDPEENRFEILADRVNTTATVWLGSTLACAQCHNHKYDPFTQKDYYRFMAFFDNAEYQIGYQSPGEDNSRFILEPQLNLPTPEQEENRKTLDATIKQIETKLKTQTRELDVEQSKWEHDLLDEQNKWIPLDPVKLESTGGATLKKLEDKSVLVSGAAAELDVYIINAKTNLKNITALRVEALPDASLPKGGPGRDPYGNFLLTGVEIEVATPDDAPREIAFKDAFVDDLAYRLETKAFFSKDPGNTATDRPPGWFVNATNDPGARLPRQGVFVAAKPFGPTGSDSSATLTIKLKHLGGSLNQGIGRFRLSVTAADEPKRVVNIPARLRPILPIQLADRTQKQRDDLSAQFRATTPSLKPDRDRLEKLRDEMKGLNITTALVMQERPGFDRPSTFFRERGSFLNKGDKVFAATPAVLPQIPENAPINRLGLARWLVDESNPLTARVTVNRFWEQIFGRGLVETSEDFGAQGERPWNSELLDWLAVEFRDPSLKIDNGATGSGRQGDKEYPQSAIRNPQSAMGSSATRNPQSAAWSMKRLVRLIVTSSAYRQSSATTPALLEKDPYNRFLARGPRFRMEAEMIRDLTLTASGLISPKLGGPSVFPLQPEGVWKAPYSGEKWSVSKGDDRYRRSLYTFVRRSSPHPAMMTFDATSREYCTVRRVRTNTPLQALTMLNDEAAMESARALARRMINEVPQKAEGSLEARVAFGFRTCAGRTPKEKEIQRIVALYQQQLHYFSGHEEEARKVSSAQFQSSASASLSEVAAWTMVANILLNLDETLTKE
jgi:hypothetical protein